MLALNFVFGKDQSHGSANGKATGRPPRSYVCTCNEDFSIIGYSLYLPISGCVTGKCRRTAAPAPTA